MDDTVARDIRMFLNGTKAWHEAGHAVIADHMGLPIGHLSLEEVDDKGGVCHLATEDISPSQRRWLALGGVVGEYLQRRHVIDYSQLEDAHDELSGTTARNDLAHLREAQISLGVFAREELEPEETFFDPEVGAYATKIVPNINAGLREVGEILLAKRVAVAAVAEALADRERIEGEEVAEIIRSSLLHH